MYERMNSIPGWSYTPLKRCLLSDDPFFEVCLFPDRTNFICKCLTIHTLIAALPKVGSLFSIFNNIKRSL